MIDVVFSIGGTDLSDLLSTYNVSIEYSYPMTVTTMDGTEHVLTQKRPILSFSFIPLTDAQTASVYNLLKNSPVTVVYTNPYTNTSTQKQMRVSSDLESEFCLRSVNGNRYYKGGTITLRQLSVM